MGVEKLLKNLKGGVKNIGGESYRIYLIKYKNKNLFPELYEGKNALNFFSIVDNNCKRYGAELGAIIMEFKGGVYGLIKKEGDDLLISAPLSEKDMEIAFPEDYRRLVEPEVPGYQ